MWVQTITGRAVPLDGSITERDIAMGDIIYSLARQPRFNGHTEHHYSVAEHSAHVAAWLRSEGYDPSVALAGLMHDAAEAYIGDVVAPLKKASADLRAALHDIEHPINGAIQRRFRCAALDHPAVKNADRRILVDEQQALFAPMARDWGLGGIRPLGVKILGLDAESASDLFFGMLKMLSKEVGNE